MTEETAARRALEQEWDRKLHEARVRYFQAANELHRQIFETSAPLDEDAPVLAVARKWEATAFAEYCRALATYTELVVNGKLPEPPASALTGIPSNPK